MKFSLGDIRLPCCLQPWASHHGAEMKILLWAPVHPSGWEGAKVALSQGSSLQFREPAVSRHRCVPFLSPGFLRFYSSCCFSSCFKFFPTFILQTGWRGNRNASAVFWASPSPWRGERWLGSSKYPASLCIFVKFGEAHAGTTCPWHGHAAGQGCVRRLFP